MENMNLRIARELNKMAKELVADYEYIYDPEHKKHPGGGYQKTEKGWQRGKQDKGGKGTARVEMTDEQKKLDIKANSDDAKIREEAASNPNTHPSTLAKLAEDKDTLVRMDVGGNPNTPTKTLDKMVQRMLDGEMEEYDEDIIVNAADQAMQNPNLSEKMIRKVAETKNNVLTRMLVGNPNVPSDVLEQLSQLNDPNDPDDYEQETRLGVASHPNCPEHVLKRLAEFDRNKIVRNSAKDTLNQIAQNKKTEQFSKIGIDLTKMSPELREKVKDWDAEDIAKFLAWLKENKG